MPERITLAVQGPFAEALTDLANELKNQREDLKPPDNLRQQSGSFDWLRRLFGRKESANLRSKPDVTKRDAVEAGEDFDLLKRLRDFRIDSSDPDQISTVVARARAPQTSEVREIRISLGPPPDYKPFEITSSLVKSTHIVHDTLRDDSVTLGRIARRILLESQPAAEVATPAVPQPASV